MLRQHRHQAEDQRQLAIVGAGQIEAHDALRQRLGLGDLDVIGAVVRPAFVAQELPGKDHVLGGHRLAVGEFRGGIEREGDVGAVGVGLDRAREQAVERERLVVAARQQALDHVAADLRQREAFDDERVEAVEGAEHALRQPAALGRRRIGVARMVEARRQRRFAVHGDAVFRHARPAPARCLWRTRPAPTRQGGARGSRRSFTSMESLVHHRSSTGGFGPTGPDCAHPPRPPALILTRA